MEPWNVTTGFAPPHSEGYNSYNRTQPTYKDLAEVGIKIELAWKVSIVYD
jgi:hypothetical protein